MLLMSHTVGTPIAITGIPRVFLFKATLLLLTPLPGWIPVSVIWIVLLSLEIELLFKESTTTTKSGLILSTTHAIISLVSIPVSPVTPGFIALICLLVFIPKIDKCLVTIILSITKGPRLSEVHLLLPRPTKSTLLLLVNLLVLKILFKQDTSTPLISLSKTSLYSIVIYFPLS